MSLGIHAVSINSFYCEADMGQKITSKEQAQRQLGAAIKRCRIERGMSRRDLQEATGRSYPYLSEIEAGKKAPSTQVLGQISAALGMEMHELIETAERGREPRGWVAPRKSHFHKAAMASPMEVDAMLDGPAAPSASAQDPVDELVHLASRLPDDDLALLVDFARRLAD
jgi:transcriptional regulator with XRE-family HTH domain